MDKLAVLNIVKKSEKMAKKVLEDDKEQLEFISDAKNYYDENRRSLANYSQGLGVLIALLSDYFSKEYDELPLASAILLIAGLLCVLLPPPKPFKKMLFGSMVYRGFILLFVLELAKEDLAIYGKWKLMNSGKTDSF